MGNYTSKLFSQHNEHDAKIKTQTNQTSPSGDGEKIKMCTPPITKRKLTTDPRSATIGIIRTPIEVTCTPPGLTRRVASALPKYLQGKRYLETDFDIIMPGNTPEKSLPDPRSPNIAQARTPIIVKSVANYFSPVVNINQASQMETPVGAQSNIDPRSPATDFDRTPILKPRSTEHATTTSDANIVPANENENTNVKLSYCETTTDYSIPEIQTISEIVESSRSEKRSSECEASKNLSSGHVSSEDISDCSESEEQITVIRNPNILTKNDDTVSTWTEEKKNVVEKGDEIDEPLGQRLDNNFREIINAVMKSTINEEKVVGNNDKIKVWRDSISPTVGEENKKCIQKPFTEEIMIEFDDDTVTKNSKIVGKVTSKIDDDKMTNQIKKKKSQRQCNGENKPLTEERKIFNTDAKNLIDATLNRTPLGNRSNNHKQRQLLSAKSPQQLFRNKGYSARSNQQENTPPAERFISKTKPNGIQWDADTTVII